MTDETGASKAGAVNYGANSQKSRQPEAQESASQIVPIIEGVAIERKEPIRKKFFRVYAGDSAQSVGSYLMTDVIIPSTKNLIADLVTQGINRLLYGTSRPSNGGIRSSVGGGMSYTKFFNGSNSSQQNTQPTISATARATHQFGEIVLQSRSDAEMVIDSLRELIEQYGNATVQNLYSLVGITSNFTDIKYGWTNLSRAQALQIREGYLLDLPRPEVLQ